MFLVISGHNIFYFLQSPKTITLSTGQFTVNSGNERLTFRPLAKGWFRCNQTGQKTKRPERYSNMVTKAAQNALLQEQQKEQQKNAEAYKNSLEKVEVSFGQWDCPKCTKLNYYGKIDSVVKCMKCHEAFHTIRRLVISKPEEEQLQFRSSNLTRGWF